MIVYNVNGTENHRICGYIYSNKYLETLRDYILNISEFHFPEYGVNFIRKLIQ